MAIFMISPKEEVDNAAEQQVQPSAQPSTTPSAEPATMLDDPSVTPKKELNEKTIVLDGPLSQVYTEALNQMYAKETHAVESYITEIASLHTNGNKLEAREPGREDTPREANNYVYVVNGHFLEDAGLEAFDRLVAAQERYEHVFVCVEHNHAITPRVASFMAYARNSGATILKDRQQALETISKTVKGK